MEVSSTAVKRSRRRSNDFREFLQAFAKADASAELCWATLPLSMVAWLWKDESCRHEQSLGEAEAGMTCKR